jgi:hypothetical protein
MKKFEIVMRRAEISWKNRKSIKEGCTTEGEPELIKSFDTLEEAKEELRKFQTSIRKLSNGSLSYFEIEEYMVEENDYDEDGEWESGGDIWEITKMHIEVNEKPSYETVATFDNYAEAENYINKYAGERELYI